MCKKRIGMFSARRLALSIILGLLTGALAGCGRPNQDNIRLRKMNQDLTAEVSGLKVQRASDQRTIDGLMKRSPRVPMLSPDALRNLWVGSGLKFGRLTGGFEGDSGKPGAAGVRVYVTPTDENGQEIQAAGSFVVEAFDLAQKGDNRIGRWEWNAVAAKSQWRFFLLEFGYEFTCLWQKIPLHPDITLRATFTDELTHIPYTAEKPVHVILPLSAATAPTTVPAR